MMFVSNHKSMLQHLIFLRIVILLTGTGITKSNSNFAGDPSAWLSKSFGWLVTWNDGSAFLLAVSFPEAMRSSLFLFLFFSFFGSSSLNMSCLCNGSGSTEWFWRGGGLCLFVCLF